ncbi:hypothetical protein ElyMa_002573800 [Elysia marginata]|uniref:Uncharacterized protein n=1 Tax=Elysia marginata TaxID=1093978 RepID=A0AAV4GYY3_9GAST|nr:hypothetical protein ElyMa_002573800 [Elysia marginata]
MKKACGTKKQGGPTRKLTAWWNEEIKEVIQTKKKLFKKWDTGEGFDPSQPDHQEPNILESEVRWAVKDSPKDKAAGDDGITTRQYLPVERSAFNG